MIIGSRGWRYFAGLPRPQRRWPGAAGPGGPGGGRRRSDPSEEHGEDEDARRVAGGECRGTQRPDRQQRARRPAAPGPGRDRSARTRSCAGGGAHAGAAAGDRVVGTAADRMRRFGR